ncbi:MAG: TIGR01906 family membrane protein [Oscillospiraceae bacterium]|jgi:integral membrane protein (TIGR01906 family)|nr:TIGR01906 family membrane protein [Oscillospiraceae bacterium]
MTKGRVWFSVLLIVILMLLVLSVSIAAPLLCRPFYYAHIDALGLPESSGFTVQEIKDAFDGVMDFCLWDKPFQTGVLRWSDEGMRHFADCAVLFRLDLAVAVGSLAALAVCWFLTKKGLHPAPIWGRSPSFWAGCILAAGFVVIAGLAALDFDRAYIIFHTLFFPGKDNWLFNPARDQTILILPQVFFRNCAILIVGILFFLCGVLIWTGRGKTPPET